LPDSQWGIRTAPLLFLTRPDVRADLKLDEGQTDDAVKTLIQLHGQASTLKGKSGPEAVAGRAAIDQAQEQWLKTRLSEAQRKRLIEIDLQWEGPAALISRPVVGEYLQLSPEQRDRVGDVVAECKRRRDAGESARVCVPRLFHETRALLTPEQAERWKTMLGPPAEFTRAGFAPAQASATDPVKPAAPARR
jgi:hypothetical protein